jgi:phospholipid/cholesterol/gamma-HCH transport system ATP-binding protein
MDEKYIIEAKNITVELGQKVVLKDVSIAIKEHETIVFIGPSGGGKTVLLKTLAGIYPPTSGEVLIEGESWQSIGNEDKHKLARKLGMLFQQGALFDTLSTLENVEFPIREHYQLPEDEIHAIAKDLLAKVNLLEAMDKRPGELSGGMQRRLGIARALALNPKIIFYDDPVAGQDPIQSDQVTNLIMDFKKKNNSTVLVVTSNMRMAFKIADRIFMVLDGKLIEAGSSEQTRHHKDPRIQQFINGDLVGPLKV